MMYSYEAVDTTGTLVTGNLEAATESAVVKALRVQNLTVTQVNAAAPGEERGAARTAFTTDITR